MNLNNKENSLSNNENIKNNNESNISNDKEEIKENIKNEINEMNNNMSELGKEKDEMINYKNLNIDFNNINNQEKETENKDIQIEKNNNNNNITISNLLFQLKQMSDKQLYLLDIISNLQKNSSEQINTLNRRIKDLEEKISNQNDIKVQNQEDNRDNMIPSNENPNYILTKLLNDNSHEKLIIYLNELKLEQIKKLDIKLIEDTLIKLSILLTEGFKTHEIISFIKGILIINKIKLKEITKKNLKDVLNYIQQNLTNLKDEDSIDISLIISYLNI
jgi:hypothetical protein